MYYMDIHRRIVSIIIIAFISLANVLAGPIFAEEHVFDSLKKINQHFDTKLEMSRKTIEKERLAALENYLPNASDNIKQKILFTMINSAGLIQQYDRVIALTETYLKKYSKSNNIWNVRLMRYDALTNSGKLDQAYQEWNTEADQANTSNWQGILQAGMMIADSYIESYQVDKPRAIYEKIKDKLSFVDDLTNLLQMKTNQLMWVGKPAPALVGKDRNGKDVNLSDYHGKIVLLEFWATWCGPCVMQIPHLKKLYEEFNDQGFEIIAISLDQDMNAWNTYIDQHELSWRHLYDGSSFMGTNARTYNISAIPASFLIGKDGRIIRSGEPNGGMERMLRRLLAKPADKKQE